MFWYSTEMQFSVTIFHHQLLWKSDLTHYRTKSGLID